MDQDHNMASESESTAQKRPFDAMEDGPSTIIDPSSEPIVDPTLEAPELPDNATPVTPVTPVTPSSDQKPKKKKSSSQQRRLEPFREGKQASVAQIRDLRLLTRFVKDFEIKIKQHEIDDYLGFSSRTSRRLRNGGPTKSELVAEGKLERHPRADNWKNGKEKKRKLALEAGELNQQEVENAMDTTMEVDVNVNDHDHDHDHDNTTVDPQLENPVPMDGPDFVTGGYRDSYDLMHATGPTNGVQGMS